jgi:hypothetical protein
MKPLMLVPVVLFAAGCAAAMKVPVMPATFTPIAVADVRSWSRASMPAKWEVMTFKFRQRNLVDGETHGGNGWVFVAPPDSLHLDFHTALGLVSGAASVLGDSALWAEPKDQVEKLVPSYHLLWAMAGIARPPAAGWTAQSSSDQKTKTLTVLYTRGSDTVLYSSQRTKLVTYVVEGGRPIGRVWAEFNELRQLRSAKLMVLSSPFSVDVSYDSIATKKPKHIDAETWNAPHDR